MNTTTSETARVAYHQRTTCRCCGSSQLRPFLSLGPMPLANSLLRSEIEFASEAFYPLDVCFCERCSLVQLVDVIAPEVLFRNYLYVTGTSETIATHNQQYAQAVVEQLSLQPTDLVVEVGSNDGSLLKCFRQRGVRTVGVEPATNIAELARASGIETVNEFMSVATAQQVRATYGPARAVIANNVLAHVDETVDFLRACRACLADDGLVIVEVPYLGELLARLEYDTIYHEHLCYFSMGALVRLCEEAGLAMVRIDRVPVHGGSLRMVAGLPAHYGGHARAVLALLQQEQSAGLANYDRYERFAARVRDNRGQLQDLLAALKKQGKTVAAYGAPAKGNTLLNYCGIGTELVPYTVDKSPLKVGLFTPGMHLPVMPVSTLLERQPDYVLLLAWNLAEEIMSQQQEYRERGGRFILPIPEPKVI